MQSQNKLLGNFTFKQKMLILIVLIILGFVFLFFSSSNEEIDISTDDNFLQTYRDPISGETVTDPIDKTSESYGQDSTKPVFLGFKELLNLGFSQAQLDSLFEAFETYTALTGVNPNEISLYPESITFNDADPATFDLDIVKMKIRVAREKDALIEVTRNSLSAITMTLTEDGIQVFSSGRVDSTLVN